MAGAELGLADCAGLFFVHVVHFRNHIIRRYHRMDQSPPRYQVICDIDGKARRGTYWVAGKILTVSTGMGGKSRQVGTTPAEILAEELLRELAREGKA